MVALLHHIKIVKYLAYERHFLEVRQFLIGIPTFGGPVSPGSYLVLT